MTILNNMVRAYRYLLGTMSGISSNGRPSDSPTFNDFYSINGEKIRLVAQSSSNVAADGTSPIYTMFYPSNVTGTTPGTSGNLINAAIVAITEDFSIVDNEYLVNNESTYPSNVICSRGASCSTTELKTTFSITYTNDTESSVSVYGFLMRGRISGWAYIGSKWQNSSSAYSCPMAVVKFDQPKVVEAGGVLQMSYTIDFSNLISEANEIVVTQQ